jgi:hypothetical protein
MSDDNEPTSYQIAILTGLQTRPQFQGLTEAGWDRVAKRRAKNKRRRATRQAQRRAAA